LGTGLNGAEITVDITSVVCDTFLEKELKLFAKSFSLNYIGLFDVRRAVSELDIFFSENEGAILVLFFEGETDILLLRDRKIAGVGVVRAGYGILVEALSKTFSVGYEESKEIFRRFREGTLEDESKSRVGDILKKANEKLKNGAFDAIAKIDPMNLLPGNLWFILPRHLPELQQIFEPKEWLSDFPIEKNAAIHFVDNTPFGSIIEDRSKSFRKSAIFFDWVVLSYLFQKR